MRKQAIAAAIVVLGCVFGTAWQPARAAAPVDQRPDASQPTTVEQTPTLREVVTAMQEGDVQALTRLYQVTNYPIVHVWAAMALERVHFNLAAATADAKMCEDSLIDQRPRIALQCGQFQVGNLRLVGKIAESDKLEGDLIKRFESHGVDDMLAEMREFLDSESAIPAFAIDRPNADVVLPLDGDSNQPRFDAKADGHNFKLMLDTGATDIVLGEDEAQVYGVKLLDKHGHTRGWLSKGVPTQHGVLDELRIGAITLHNVPVRVVPKRIGLIGANLLAPLGTLAISKSALTIYGPQAPTPACDAPMLVATPLWGQSLRIVPQLKVNDTLRSVMLDTGAGHYLLGTAAALSEVTVLHRGKIKFGDIGGRRPFANAQSAKVMITIAGQPIEMYFDILTDSSNPHAITLGAGALRDMDFLLDFQHQRQCFLLHPGLH